MIHPHVAHHVESRLPHYGQHLAQVNHFGGPDAFAREHAQTVVHLGAIDPAAGLHLHMLIMRHLHHGGYTHEAQRLHQLTADAVNQAAQWAHQHMAQQPMPQQQPPMQPNMAPTTGLPQSGAPGQRSA